MRDIFVEGCMRLRWVVLVVWVCVMCRGVMFSFCGSILWEWLAGFGAFKVVGSVTRANWLDAAVFVCRGKEMVCFGDEGE